MSNSLTIIINFSMKNYIFYALFVLASLPVQAQSKIIEIKPSNKHKFLGFEHAENGMFYIVTGQEKKPKSDVEILSYDPDLNLNYKKNIQSNYKGLPAFFGRGMNDSPIYYELYSSKSGKFSIATKDGLIIDKDGNQKAVNFDEKSESGTIKSYFNFYSDEYACYLGKIEGKKKKDKDADGAIYLFRRSLIDQSTKLIELHVPEIETSEDKIGFLLHSYDEQGFYIVNKKLDKKLPSDTYNILKYDYDGKLISDKRIEVTLKNKYFTASNCGLGSSTVIFGDGFTKHVLSENSTGNVYIDETNNAYYIFGLYSNTKDGNLYNARNNGFYIKKYNSNGELLWDSVNEIQDKDYNKNAVSYFTAVSFFNLKGKLGLRISSQKHDYSHMFLLNEKDGKVTNTKKVEFSVSPILLNGIRGGSFPTGYSSKADFGKLNLNVDTFFASFASKNVEAFFKSVKDKKYNYNSFILENGIYLLEENLDNESFRLIKFDYN